MCSSCTIMMPAWFEQGTTKGVGAVEGLEGTRLPAWATTTTGPASQVQVTVDATHIQPHKLEALEAALRACVFNIQYNRYLAYHYRGLSGRVRYWLAGLAALCTRTLLRRRGGAEPYAHASPKLGMSFKAVGCALVLRRVGTGSDSTADVSFSGGDTSVLFPSGHLVVRFIAQVFSKQEHDVLMTFAESWNSSHHYDMVKKDRKVW